MGVPTYYIRLLKEARLNKESCRYVRLFVSGSAPLLSTTFNQFLKITGHEILERYGMTETGINMSNPLSGKRKVGTVGLPLPHVTVRVVNETGMKLNANEVGSIQVKGNNLFKGYWKKLEKTQEDFTVDGFFNTGDLGCFDEEGYLSIIGRSKDLIITGGLNVYPKELELTLDALDEVVESAIIGVPHNEFGEAVVAVVATNQSLDEAFIIKCLKEHHASYKCPKKIFFIDLLPKNAMGKVQKNVLRERFKNIFNQLIIS